MNLTAKQRVEVTGCLDALLEVESGMNWKALEFIENMATQTEDDKFQPTKKQFKWIMDLYDEHC